MEVVENGGHNGPGRLGEEWRGKAPFHSEHYEHRAFPYSCGYIHSPFGSAEGFLPEIEDSGHNSQASRTPNLHRMRQVALAWIFLYHLL